jgi:hypothetical protein
MAPLQRRAQRSTHTWRDAPSSLAIGDQGEWMQPFMEPSGRNWWQPATNGTPLLARWSELDCIASMRHRATSLTCMTPSVQRSSSEAHTRTAPGRVSARMVRRGSTVRVRQRPLQRRRKPALCCMCSVGRGAAGGLDGAVFGALASRTPSERSAFWKRGWLVSFPGHG